MGTMMFTITKEFAFSASHVLQGLPEGHQCGRLHGHNYVVAVELASETLDGTGFVMDYGDLAFVKAYIDTQLDHRHLNDHMINLNPTAEHLARWIHHEVQQTLIQRDLRHIKIGIGISETPKTWAWYRP